MNVRIADLKLVIKTLEHLRGVTLAHRRGR